MIVRIIPTAVNTGSFFSSPSIASLTALGIWRALPIAVTRKPIESDITKLMKTRIIPMTARIVIKVFMFFIIILFLSFLGYSFFWWNVKNIFIWFLGERFICDIFSVFCVEACNSIWIIILLYVFTCFLVKRLNRYMCIIIILLGFFLLVSILNFSQKSTEPRAFFRSLITDDQQILWITLTKNNQQSLITSL